MEATRVREAQGTPKLQIGRRVLRNAVVSRSPETSMFQTRLKDLSAACATVAACRPIAMHRGLRNVDHEAAVWAGRVQLMNEVGE